MQNLLRQRDAELRQANAELEERGKLLYKTKVGQDLRLQLGQWVRAGAVAASAGLVAGCGMGHGFDADPDARACSAAWV